MNRATVLVTVLLVASTALASTSLLTPAADPAPVLFYACAAADGTLQSATLRLGTAPVCKKGTTLTSWNNLGPQGVQGLQGLQGLQGPQGPVGPAGEKGEKGEADPSAVAWYDANGTVAARQYPRTASADPPWVVQVDGKLFRVDIAADGSWAANGPPAIAYESTDCSGPDYYTVTLSSYDVGIGYTIRAGDDPTTYLLEFDPSSTTFLDIKSYFAAGECVTADIGILPAMRLVAMHDLTALHPGTLVLR